MGYRISAHRRARRRYRREGVHGTRHAATSRQMEPRDGRHYAGRDMLVCMKMSQTRHHFALPPHTMPYYYFGITYFSTPILNYQCIAGRRGSFVSLGAS